MKRSTNIDERGRSARHSYPKVPPPDSPVWPEEYRGDRWKPVYAFFFAGKCQLCAYSLAQTPGRQSLDKFHGQTRLLLCANHPRYAGRLIDVLPTDTCRNFKPKRWWTSRAKPKPGPALPPPLADGADPTIRHIPVGNDGLFATVDAADYPKLCRYKWFPMRRGRLTYAFCHLPDGRVMSMHRMLMKPRRHEVVDHIDHNGLNNRCSCNLRSCTQRQNLANTRPCADAKIYDNTPHYIGVRRHRDKWQAGIVFRGKFYHLGLFTDPVEAAKARDQKAYEFWGPYAYLNFPEDYPKPGGTAPQRNPKHEIGNSKQARRPKSKCPKPRHFKLAATTKKKGTKPQPRRPGRTRRKSQG